MLQRNLVFTDITRGKQLVVLLSQTKVLAMTVMNHLDRSATPGWSRDAAIIQSWLPADRTTLNLPGRRIWPKILRQRRHGVWDFVGDCLRSRQPPWRSSP